MGNTLLIAKKEIGSLLMEKTLVLAIIIQLLIASFSSLLVIGLASLFDPAALDRYGTEKTEIGIIGGGELIQFLEKSQVKPYYYGDINVALSDFNRNRIDAILVVPPVGADSGEIIQLLLYLPKSDIKGTLVTLQLKKPLEEYEAFVRDVRAPRVGFKPVRLYVDELPRKTSTYFEFIYGVLIPLLVFTPVFISGGLIIDMLTEEYERKTMELLRVSPVSFTEILNGKMLTAVVIVPLQALLWLSLVGLNRIAIYNIWSILLLVSIIAAVIVMIGAVIAVKYKDRAISQYLYSLILIPVFLSGYLFAESPFNLVARLSAGATGAESLLYSGLYAVMAVPLYIYLKRIHGQ